MRHNSHLQICLATLFLQNRKCQRVNSFQIKTFHTLERQVRMTDCKSGQQMPLEKPCFPLLCGHLFTPLLQPLIPKQNKCNIMMSLRSGLTQSFTTLSVIAQGEKQGGVLTSAWCKSLPSTATVWRKDVERTSVKEGPPLKSIRRL